VLQARARGAPIICIDPIRTRTPRNATSGSRSDRHGRRAGARDDARALRKGLEDRDYLEQYTLGHDALRLRAAEWTPERTASVTGIPVETIVSLGERFGRARAAFIRVNYGCSATPAAVWPCATSPVFPRSPVIGVARGRSAAVDVGELHLQQGGARTSDLGPQTRTINMIRLGDALTLPDAGVGGPP